LGDKDQLASVEAGTILGDLCEEMTLEISDPFTDSPIALEQHLVLLNKTYRFSEPSGIWALAQAVKAGQSEKALPILKTETYADVEWHHLGLPETMPTILIEKIVAHLADCLAVTEPAKFLQQFEQTRILCAARRGPLGIETVNRQLEEALNRKGLIRPRSRWYHGRPIMITRNDYTLRLFNGDVGVIFKTGDHDELQAFFPTAEGQLRAFWPNRLPEHETVYALTIHKSQGSEFDNVSILLPTQASTWLTRELVYTAITRARRTVKLWANERVLKAAIGRKINRASGLREALQRKIDHANANEAKETEETPYSDEAKETDETPNSETAWNS
jgi:exodeoxyribonuclease V alpha subunit